MDAIRHAHLGLLVALLALAACAPVPQRPAPAGTPVPAPGGVASAGPGATLALAARRHLGAPYRFGGADPAAGFDCSGLVWYVHREAGIAVPRTAAEQRARATPVPLDALRPGDLVFFSTPRDHVGIYLGDGEFVHAPASGRRVERARLDAPWFLLGYAGAGRFSEP